MGHFDHSLPESFIPSKDLDPMTGHPVMLMDAEVVLDGQHLTIADLVLLGKGRHKIKLRSQAEAKVLAGRNLVDALLKENKVQHN